MSTIDAERFLEDHLARRRPVSKWSAFREGVAAPLVGLKYLRCHPRLWRYAVIPIVLNLLITGLALILFLAAVVGFLTYLHPVFPPGWGWLLSEILCGVVALLLALGATLMTWMVLQAVLCDHYYEELARQVELQLGMQPEDMVGLPLREQIGDVLRDLTLLVGVNLGFLLLHLVPVLGSIIGILGSLYFTCYLLGTGYLGYPLCLRRQHRKQRVAFTRRFRAQTVGLGAVVSLAALLPVVGSFVLATAVVGTVLLHRRLEDYPPSS